MRRDPGFPRIYLQQGTARVRNATRRKRSRREGASSGRGVWPDTRLILALEGQEGRHGT